MRYVIGLMMLMVIKRSFIGLIDYCCSDGINWIHTIYIYNKRVFEWYDMIMDATLNR